MPLPNNAPLPDAYLATSMLKQAGVRTTEARQRALLTLLSHRHAMSHLEIQDALPDMDRVTLYRALDCLTESGLAHKISGDDRVFRYSTGNDRPDTIVQDKTAQHQHGHFRCTRCNRVFCLDNAPTATSLRDQLRATLDATLGRGFQSHDIELTIKGWCADCAQ